MSWTIDLSPIVPALLLWIGAGLSLILAVLLMVRQSRGAFLRALSLAALLLALAT
jgi:hypothetical protein